MLKCLPVREHVMWMVVSGMSTMWLLLQAGQRKRTCIGVIPHVGSAVAVPGQDLSIGVLGRRRKFFKE